MRLIRLLLGYMAREKSRFAVVFGLALLGVVFQLAGPWPLKIVADYVIGGRPLPGRLAQLAAWLPNARSAAGLLFWAIVLGVVCAVGRGVVEIAARAIMIGVAQRMVLDLQQRVFARLQRLSLAFHGRHQVGDLVQRLGADVFVVQAALSAVALPAVISLLALVGMIVIMSKLSGALTLIAVSVLPVLALSLAVFARPMRRTAQQQWKRQGAMMAFVEQSLSAMRVIQGFARETYIQRALDARARDLGRAYGESLLVGTGYNQLNTAVTGVAAAVVLGAGGARVLDGTLSLGDLLVFLGYLAALFGPATALATAIGTGVAAVPRARRVFEVLDSVEELPERADAITLGRARGEVAFEDVTFGYEARAAVGPAERAEGAAREEATREAAARPPERGREVLRGVSFRAEPGQVTAIVGATGAGKSSLVSLLSRFYDPWEGRVLVDGHDVRDLAVRSLRENVSLVLQEPFLFPMTIAENIAFGRADVTRAEVVEAAKLARAHRFIERLPQGYDTPIGEKGSTLSGGERQRIAIARAVLKDAPILVLDEPTSSLDANTERQIFAALSELMHQRTTFIISHRLTTIRRADVILALDDGRIAERGTHESLLAEDNVYASLYKHQHLAAL